MRPTTKIGKGEIMGPTLRNGQNRRDFLRVGAFGSLSLADGIRLRAMGPPLPVRAKSCILIWLDGGPSHLETFDLKPNVPDDV
ncbi:MAG: DUF1501 domain-containing protein, partial [Planctomycetota bacterium]